MIGRRLQSFCDSPRLYKDGMEFHVSNSPLPLRDWTRKRVSQEARSGFWYETSEQPPGTHPSFFFFLPSSLYHREASIHCYSKFQHIRKPRILNAPSSELLGTYLCSLQLLRVYFNKHRDNMEKSPCKKQPCCDEEV